MATVAIPGRAIPRIQTVKAGLRTVREMPLLAVVIISILGLLAIFADVIAPIARNYPWRMSTLRSLRPPCGQKAAGL